MEEAERRFEAFLAAPEDPSVLSADIRGAVFRIVMRNDPNRFDRLVAIHNAAKDGAFREHVYRALAAALSREDRLRALGWSLSGAVRSQDLIALPMIMSKEPLGSEAVLEWVQTRIEEISARLGKTSTGLFARIVDASANSFVTNERADAVKAFWEKQDMINTLRRSLDQALEGIRSRAVFLGRLCDSELAKAKFWEELSSNIPSL